MTRFRVSSSLLLTVAAFAGCASEPTYNGAAKLQPVKFFDQSNTAVKGDVGDAATRYLREFEELTGYGDDWKLRIAYNTVGAAHVRLDQIHAGVPVFGADVVVHTRSGKFHFVSGNRVANLAGFDVTPSYEEDSALATAKADYNSKVTKPRSELAYDRESTKLVILPRRGSDARLAWHVRFYTEQQGGIDPGLWNYFIDAKTGELLDSFNSIHTVVPQASGAGGNPKVSRRWDNALDVKRLPNGSYAMDTDRLLTLNMNQQTTGGTIVTGPLNEIGDAAINDAHGFAEVTLNMLDEWQGFNSIDNEGFVIRSRVHYAFQYENAFWDGTQMTYGDGRDIFYPLPGDVDVVAHEINHGFTTFHSNLAYRVQSGGMNESFSDIAGTVADFFIDGDGGDFDIGRDVFKTDNALRFMCDPTADGRSIDHFADYNDGIDVHFSSGIMNKAFCRASRRFASGDPEGPATQAAVRRVSQAFYRANAAFWTANSTFREGCDGLLDAARDLGFSETEQAALRTSWADVGVFCDGETEPLVCDETFTTDHGELTSPNFPSNYPNQFRRTYCIIPASGAAATLHFVNFDTEEDFDFVSVKNAAGEEVANVSGQTPPPDLTSTTIVVKFTTDQSVTRPGWKATW